VGTLPYAADSGYQVIKTLQLGGEGGWDYLRVDSESKRLYISRSAHPTVVGIKSAMVVGDTPDTPGIQGIAVAPELNRRLISNGRTNRATVSDFKNLKGLGKVKTEINFYAIL
jgi:hypothetical protein